MYLKNEMKYRNILVATCLLHVFLCGSEIGGKKDAINYGPQISRPVRIPAHGHLCVCLFRAALGNLAICGPQVCPLISEDLHICVWLTEHAPPAHTGMFMYLSVCAVFACDCESEFQTQTPHPSS